MSWVGGRSHICTPRVGGGGIQYLQEDRSGIPYLLETQMGGGGGVIPYLQETFMGGADPIPT